MRLNKLKSGIILALCLSLLMTAVIPAIAADANTQPQMHTPADLGKINIDSNSYFTLKNIAMLTDQGRKTVAFTLTLVNNGSSDINFIDYWVNVKSASGSDYTVNMIDADKDKNRVAPQSEEDFTFYSNVGSNVSLQDIVIQLIKWDFSLDTYERALGTFKIPADYSIVTPAGMAAQIDLSQTELKVWVDRVSINSNDKNHKVEVRLELNNIGDRTTSLPAFQFAIRTPEGLSYPLTAAKVEGLSILPRDSESVTLSGTIPASIAVEGWELEISERLQNNLSIPIAAFFLQEATQQDSGVVGQSYTFNNDDGEYHVVLNSVSRLPLEDQDVITASFTISNEGTSTLPIPALGGKFVLDDVVDQAAQTVSNDQVIGLQPGTEVQLQLYAAIPYTYTYSELKVVLQEGTGESADDLLEFIASDSGNGIPELSATESYMIDDIGFRSSYDIRNVKTFEGKSSDILSIEMDVTNLEKRMTGLSDITAYFEFADGTVYPANITKVDSKLRPNGKALIRLWNVLPPGIDSKGAKLIIGQSVRSGDSVAAYVNPASVTLPEEHAVVADSLRELDLYPHTLTFNEISSSVNFSSGDLNVKFEYELSQDLLVEFNNEQSTIVIEISDDEEGIAYEKTYSLETSDGTLGENPLKLGDNEGIFTHNDPEFVFKVKDLENFNFNVYHQFQNGYKKLIASKEIRWFSTVKLNEK